MRTLGAHAGGDRGSVTAETAAVLPVLGVVLSAALWAVSAGAAHVRCLDAAREGARLAARGESAAAVVAVARATAPSGATVGVSVSGDRVRVVVTDRVTPFGGIAGRVGALAVSASATSAVEPGSVDGTGP